MTQRHQWHPFRSVNDTGGRCITIISDTVEMCISCQWGLRTMNYLCQWQQQGNALQKKTILNLRTAWNLAVSGKTHFLDPLSGIQTGILCFNPDPWQYLPPLIFWTPAFGCCDFASLEVFGLVLKIIQARDWFLSLTSWFSLVQSPQVQPIRPRD